MVGSQTVPYIYEDYASQEDVANGLMKLYRQTDEEKKALKAQILDYVDSEFVYERMIEDWDRTLMTTIEKWESEKKTRKQWSVIPLDKPMIPVVPPPKKPTVLPESPFRKIHPNVLQRLGARG
jgi:hypothetical protein